VQVGAFATTAKMRDARGKVEKLGLKTYTQSVDTPAASASRVRVGPYPTKADADRPRRRSRPTACRQRCCRAVTAILDLGWVDLALLAVLCLSVLVGLWRGFVFEIVSLLGWVSRSSMANTCRAAVEPVPAHGPAGTPLRFWPPG
jgi:hypothetical protein